MCNLHSFSVNITVLQDMTDHNRVYDKILQTHEVHHTAYNNNPTVNHHYNISVFAKSLKVELKKFLLILKDFTK